MKGIGICILSVTPVSYTHLDVYKRQRTGRRLRKNNFCLHSILNGGFFITEQQIGACLNSTGSRATSRLRAQLVTGYLDDDGGSRISRRLVFDAKPAATSWNKEIRNLYESSLLPAIFYYEAQRSNKAKPITISWG